MNDNKKTWATPNIKSISQVTNLTRNVFKAGTGDTQPGMNTILAPS